MVDPPSPAIEARDLRFAFHHGEAVLRGLTLSVPAGESLGLVGPNGAGKTTLFLVMVGIHRLHGGALSVAGLDVAARANLTEIRRCAGIVFQNSDDQLFSATVRDDVAFGPLNLGLDRGEVERRVAASLEQVEASHLAQRVSHHLSAGEKRRVALATILAMEPQILLLDEPTNDLDPRGRRELINLLQDLPHTRLVASHDLAFILETCQRVAIIDEGRIVADGDAREILADAVLMERHGLEVPGVLRGK